MTAEDEDFSLLNHFTFLIYPFAHQLTEESRKKQIESLACAWNTWWSRLAKEQIAKAVDDTFFFLPYIREVLFPETTLFANQPPGKNYANWVTEIGRIKQQGVAALVDELPADANLRLTYRPDSLSKLADFNIHPWSPDGTPRPIAVHVDWLDAMLFASGIGFMIFKVRLKDAPEKLSHLIDMNYFLRSVHPPTVSWSLPTLSVGHPPTMMSFRDLIDFLLQGLTGSEASITMDISEFINSLKQPKRSRFTESTFGQVYGERCQFLSYACVDMAGAQQAAAGAGAFLSAAERLLYEFASCIPLGHSVTDPMWIPTPEVVAGLAANRISIWRSWQGMAFKESVVFLATEDIIFNRQGFPNNIESDYLSLYIYTLYQKFQLFLFSDDLMRKGAHVERHLKEVRGLMDRFVVFRNRYWFSEITRKSMGSELYQKFQYGLGVSSLYDCVCNEVKDLEGYHERRHEKHVSLLLNLFTFVFLPLGAVIGVFGMTFFYGSWKSFITSCLIVSLISLSFWKWWTQE